MAFSFPNPSWSPTTTYALDALANYQGTDYISLASGNIGNIPPNTLGTKWALYTDWSSGTTHIIGDKVTYNGLGYVSLANSNLNHIPSSTTGTWWARLVVGATVRPAATAFKFSVPAALMGTLHIDARSFLTPPVLTVSRLQMAVGLNFYRVFLGNPQQSPGPTNPWQGRVVFRVPRTGWFTGLGRRANEPGVSHNNGD